MDSSILLKGLSEKAKKEAAEFLKISHLFKLGDLPTECPHPHTVGLSDLAKKDLPAAINRLKDLDVKTIEMLISKVGELDQLHKDITSTLDSGNRVFICGCGATGRLALALESLWRQEVALLWRGKDEKKYKEYFDRVISFMAGGDVALIKAVEDFEDHPEFGQRQLEDLGFAEGDLLIGNTEGGETSWVIGCVEAVSTQLGKKYKRKPYFLYGNPDEVLVKTVERSRRVIQSPDIIKINVNVGPMGITGSTRMQSTTILMYAIGLPLLRYHALRADSKSFIESANEELNAFMELFKGLDEGNFLAPYTAAESEAYKAGNYLFYETDPYFAISILTDTTERSPTFSLFPFENQRDPPEEKVASLGHLILLMTDEMKKGKSPEEILRLAWYEMLGGRPVRALNGEYWAKYKEKVSEERVFGHNFSEDLIPLRRSYTPAGSKHHTFRIDKLSNKIKFLFKYDGEEKEISKEIDVSSLKSSRLAEHILVKIFLNTHSTLVMGLLGKYESNIMIFVRPSNYKLIDRSIRYITYMIDQKREELRKKNPENFDKIDYSLVCHALYSEIENLKYGEAIVVKTFNRILKDLFES